MSTAPIKAFQWDLARQVERLDFLHDQLPRYAAWGYQELYLHLEDAVHYPSLPGIGRDDAYGYDELGELVLAAAQNGIRVVPIVNLLGHTQYLLKHPELRDLNERRDERGRPLERGQICPLHPRTLEVAEKLLRDMAPYCTAGKVHVGLDESFHLGQCPRCREEVARIGLAGHFASHVNRLHALAGKFNLQLGLWADMLYFIPEAIPLLPRGITAYDWYYYPFGKKPRVEFFNFAERDLATPLKKHGIGYYGCPMNGAFRHEPLPVFGDRIGNLRSWWRRCAEVSADGFLVTSWEANRLALELTTVVDAAAANLWLEPDATDATTMLARGFERGCGKRGAREAARAALASDEFAFTGYARWQINDRWDVFAGTEGLKRYERERDFFVRLDKGRSKTAPLPEFFRACIAFRRYLAERDLFVRRAARDVFKIRKLLTKGRANHPRDRTGCRPGEPRLGGDASPYLKAMQSRAAEFAQALRAGRTAARAMWARTRDRQVRGPNEEMLEADERRLAEWRAWLKRAAKRPAIANDATPVCGGWQLQFMVHNFAPAVQKVIVEQQAADGAWRELAGRFTIEFRAQAARPASKIKREFTVPVEGDFRRDSAVAKARADRQSPPPTNLRIAVRGVGQVAISHVTLTNGVETRAMRPPGRKKILGRKAPGRGFPLFDLERNAAEWRVKFGRG